MGAQAILDWFGDKDVVEDKEGRFHIIIRKGMRHIILEPPHKLTLLKFNQETGKWVGIVQSETE